MTVRSIAVAALIAMTLAVGARADDGPIAPLIQKLHGDYPAQKAASEALIALGANAVPALIALCDDPDENMRWHAVDLLGAIRDPRGLDALAKRVLEDADVHVRWRSIWAIGGMDPATVAAKLLAGLKADDARIQWNAAVALATMSRKEAVPVLYRGLDAESEWQQWEAVNALGTVHDDKTAAALIRKLQSPYASVAREAVLSLGRLGDAAAVEPLVEALHSADVEMRWRAVIALERIGDARAVAAIRKQLRVEKDQIVRRQLEESLRERGKR